MEFLHRIVFPSNKTKSSSVCATVIMWWMPRNSNVPPLKMGTIFFFFATPLQPHPPTTGRPFFVDVDRPTRPQVLQLPPLTISHHFYPRNSDPQPTRRLCFRDCQVTVASCPPLICCEPLVSSFWVRPHTAIVLYHPCGPARHLIVYWCLVILWIGAQQHFPNTR